MKMPTLHSHTHLQATQTLTQTKACKRVCLYQRIDEEKNNEMPTKAICNKGFSGISSILPRSNFGLGRQESSPQSLTAHSLSR
jgi:heterodisulfide reductase subunit A-like polyferredoxin